jgi:hypothetical protein
MDFNLVRESESREVMTAKVWTNEALRVLAIRLLKRAAWHGYGQAQQVGFSCGIILSELTSYQQDIPDAIGWTLGASRLIECKASRADFYADQKKPQRRNGAGAGGWRYYLAPVGVIPVGKLPKGWGLLEVDGNGKVTETQEAPRRILSSKDQRDEKVMLLSTIRRIRTREFLIISSDHLENTLDIAAQS